MKETFIIRTEWYEAISELSTEDQSTMLQNLFHYHMDNENLINLNNLSVRLVWKLIEPNLRRNIESYDRRTETSSENGKKGGRPKKQANENLINLNKPTEKPIENKEPIESLSDSVLVSDSESDLLKVVVEQNDDDPDFLKKNREEARLLKQQLDAQEEERKSSAKKKEEDAETFIERKAWEYKNKNPGKHSDDFYEDFIAYWTSTDEHGKQRWQNGYFNISRAITNWHVMDTKINQSKNERPQTGFKPAGGLNTPKDYGATAVFADNKIYGTPRKKVG